MMPARFVECRKLIGWTRMHLAQRLECSENVLRQMEQGKQAITEPLAVWLDHLARFHQENPPPSNWRARALFSENRD